MNKNIISVYNKYPQKEDFIREAAKIKPNAKRKTLSNNWYECRKSKSINKDVHKYDNDEKEELDRFRKLLWLDIKKHKKPRTKEYLQRFGFTTYQINKLEDDGELDGLAQDVHTEEDK